MPRAKRPAQKASPEVHAVGVPFDADHGVPPELVDQFAPGQPDRLREWMNEALARSSARADQPEVQAELVLKEVAALFRTTDGKAWFRLQQILGHALHDPVILASREVESFVSTLAALAEDGLFVGNRGIFKRISIAGAAKAGKGVRTEVAKERAAILSHWKEADARDDPVHGRIAAIAKRMSVDRSAVEYAVKRLRESGEIKARKRANPE